ncbi:hypothetical protein Q3G72_030747 [Acer saccharum]|nr:hypothetical protein Q3G72_030747 [Acer saccharum]
MQKTQKKVLCFQDQVLESMVRIRRQLQPGVRFTDRCVNCSKSQRIHAALTAVQGGMSTEAFHRGVTRSRARTANCCPDHDADVFDVC